MKKMKGCLVNLVLVTASILVIFVVLEAAARIYLRFIADEDTFFHYASLRQLQQQKWEERVAFKYSPHRYLGYYPTPNHRYRENRHNALGYRGGEIAMPKPAGEFRIVCIGGSTTYTGHVNDWRLAYPAQLEAQLKERGFNNVSVVNAGVEGWTTYESLINFELRILDLEPDLIVVYHAINDMIGRFVWPPEMYRGDNSGSRGPFISERFMPNILEYSTLARAIMIRSGWMLPHSALPKLYDVYEPTFYGFTWREQVKDGNYPSGIFENVSAKEMLDVNPPRYFRRNVESLQAIAQAHGVATVLATFFYSQGFEDEPWVTSKEFLSTYDEANAILRDIATQTDAVLFDLAGTFPKNPELFTDGIHLTAEGARIKAGLIADFLVEQHLVSPSGNAANDD